MLSNFANIMKANKNALFLLLFFIVLGGGFLGYYYYEYKKAPRQLRVYGNPGHKVEPFSFINQFGDTITEKNVEGKIKIVEYFFTTCQGICPKMNDNMAKVYQHFRGDNDIVILSHTVDPETDTVEQMKRYSEKFDADPKQWQFLTGSKHDLYTAAINSYLITVVEDTTKKILPDFIHSEFFILVDKNNRVRGSYDGTKMDEVNQLIKDIKSLKEERN